MKSILSVLLFWFSGTSLSYSTFADQLPRIYDREKTNETREYIESKNIPVEFFGKTVDQDGKPLTGVKIIVKVRHVEVIAPTAFGADYKLIPIELESDSNGRFQISGVTGDGFELESIQKSGYEPEPTRRSFGFSGGSFTEPVIFKMWDTNIHEKLITGSQKFQIEPDGRAYFIDLTKGSISEFESGDLKIWIKRPKEIANTRRYDWSCGIEVVNGGLLKETNRDASMYLAPPDGYTNSFNYDESASTNGWGDTTGPEHFYVHLNGNKFGRVSIELYAYFNRQNPGMIRLFYAINPSGSRILQ